jgi:hypothetical protein
MELSGLVSACVSEGSTVRSSDLRNVMSALMVFGGGLPVLEYVFEVHLLDEF